MQANKALIDFIIKHQTALINIDLIRDLWMIPDRLIATHDKAKLGDENAFFITTPSPIYVGKLFVYLDKFYVITKFERVDDRQTDDKHYHVVAEATDIKYSAHEKQPLCTPQDTFTLKSSYIANYTDNKSVETTIGLFVANYIFFVYPFNEEIPYLNDTFSASKMEKLIGKRLLDRRISVEAVKDKYVNALSLFGQANEIICPGISEKTITIPKSITSLRERLVAENKAALEAGDASVMSGIEQQLIKAYRDYLQGDSSLHFLLKPKYFNVTLKKLFLTQGITEIFGQPGKYVFVDNPMGNGWKEKDLPVIFNEVRSGSYSRAIETADGGVIAKLILRVLQDIRIDTDNCGTKQGELVHGTKDTLTDFVWNYVIEKNGDETMITNDNMDSFIGKDIVIRTPGYCKAPRGYCKRCFGHTFEQLSQEAFAPVANDFARNITTSALKKMHGTSHSVADVSNINRYLMEN